MIPPLSPWFWSAFLFLLHSPSPTRHACNICKCMTNVTPACKPMVTHLFRYLFQCSMAMTFIVSLHDEGKQGVCMVRCAAWCLLTAAVCGRITFACWLKIRRHVVQPARPIYGLGSPLRRFRPFGTDLFSARFGSPNFHSFRGSLHTTESVSLKQGLPE